MWNTHLPRNEQTIWVLSKIKLAAILLVSMFGPTGAAGPIAEADTNVMWVLNGNDIPNPRSFTVGESPTHGDGLGFADAGPTRWAEARGDAYGEDPAVSYLDALLSEWSRAVPAMGCYDCNICGFWRNKHRVDGNPPPGGGFEAAHVESCNKDGTCADHKKCGAVEMAETLGEITQAVRWAESEVLVAVVGRHPEWMRINHDRQALQLVGCEGSIVASYPVATLPALAGLLQ